MPPRGRPRKRTSTLPPSVYESHGAYYHVVKNVWHPLGNSLPAALEAYGRRVEPGAREGELNPLIDGAFARMKARKNRPLKPNTVKQYTIACRKLKHLLRKFTKPEQVKQRDAHMLMALLAPTPRQANSVLSFARLVFTEFAQHQLIDSNPFVGVKGNSIDARTRLITPAEWNTIYTSASPRMQCVLDGLYLTGQRINDLLDVDDSHMLEDGIYFKQRKTSKELIVAWNPQLREWVARCRALYGNVLRVDFGIKGKPLALIRTRRGRRPAYMTVYNEWIALLAKVGVEDCNMHDNRALSGTDAQRQGLDPQKLLGHDDPRTTKTYLRGREIDIVQGPQMKRMA